MAAARLGDDLVPLGSRRISLKSWSIFSLLEKDFLSKVKLACVFGQVGNEAIVVTFDDEVFALGSNGAGCHGVGDMNSSLTPRKIEALSQKKLLDFAYGVGPHVLALTNAGEIYAWGHNGYCQLGNGNSNHGLNPTLLQGSLSGKVVASVACGSHHSLALTNEGDVFAWGQNNCGQIGSGTTTNQTTPKKILYGHASKFPHAVASRIVCGQTSSILVLDSGEVFGWGYNGNGQLGTGNAVNQLSPMRIASLNGLVIVKVVCGYAHTLALTDEGHLYAWGANSYGQLGTGNKSNSTNPIRVSAESLGRITDIAATHYSHISTAVTHLTSTCYIWGQCHGQSVVSPVETPFHNLHEVFNCFSTPAVTPHPMEAETNPGPSLVESFKLAFDDSETADVKFLVEGREINAHRALLKIRCQHFRSMFQHCWEENDNSDVEINQFTYPVYKAFLNYLYCDEVTLMPDDAIGLLDLANSYCEANLKRRCEELIMQGITVENAAMLYATAIKYLAKDLEEFCFKFCLNHMTAVTQTEAFQKLDDELCKMFIAKAAQNGAFKS